MAVGGDGVLAHAGGVLPRLLADRVGLSGGLSRAVTRAGFTPLHDRGRVLVDAATALCAGAACVTDVEALSRQNALLGGRGASDNRLLAAPARLITHARRRVLRIPTTWAWAQAITTAWERLRALHPA